MTAATVTPIHHQATEPQTIVRALASVMEDVRSVHKGDTNVVQGFKFRGIDAVVNAVGPALRTHGVIVTPDIESVDYGTVEVGRNRTQMGHVRVKVRYTFHGPAGDSLSCSVAAESMDAGDKATAKAMSVAFRTALLQALCLPTDEPDPDSAVYDRSPAGMPSDGQQAPPADQQVPPADQERLDLINAVARYADMAGIDKGQILNDWADGHDGQHIKDATNTDDLRKLRDSLKAQVRA